MAAPPCANRHLHIYFGDLKTTECCLSLCLMYKSNLKDISYWFKLLKSFILTHLYMYSSVGRGCRMHWMHLCRRVSLLHPSECPNYGMKSFEGEALVKKLLGIWNTPPLPLLPLGVVVPDRIPSMYETELFNYLIVCEQMIDVKFNC